MDLVAKQGVEPGLTRLVEATEAITGGDLDAEVPQGGRDEIGALARTLALFRCTQMLLYPKA